MDEGIISLETIKEQLDRIERYATLAAKTNFTLEEAAWYMGVTRSYLYQLTSTHEVPFYKPRGKLIYFSKSDLDNWMLQGKIHSNAEIQEEVDKYESARIIEEYLGNKSVRKNRNKNK